MSYLLVKPLCELEKKGLKQVFSVLMLIMLCIGSLTFAIKIQPVRAHALVSMPACLLSTRAATIAQEQSSTSSISQQMESERGSGPGQPLPADSPTVLLSVPYYSQVENYYCGEACLQMIFNYYGPDVNQYDIADVARAQSGPGTYTADMLRAAQFSNMSTSQGNDMPGHTSTGYRGRYLGYGSFQYYFGSAGIPRLEALINQGHPIIVLTWYDSSHTAGHYRVVIGYDSGGIIAQDPWDGPDQYYSNSLFADLWSYSNYWGMFASPWNVQIYAPISVPPNSPFEVDANITYVCPVPFGLYSEYMADPCKATIQLPPGFSLAPGENLSKSFSNSFYCEQSSIVSWQLVSGLNTGNYSASVTAEGVIHGSMPSTGNYSAYSYDDNIGGTCATNIEVEPYLVACALKSVVGQGYLMDVTITDQGDYAENFNVTVYANTTIIASQNVTLPAGNSTTVMFTWNTSGFVYGNYALSANASILDGGTNITNNFIGGMVTVTIPGDLDGNFNVALSDLVLLALAYGTTPASGGQPEALHAWNPNADINGDLKIDSTDLAILANHYGQHNP